MMSSPYKIFEKDPHLASLDKEMQAQTSRVRLLKLAKSLGLTVLLVSVFFWLYQPMPARPASIATDSLCPILDYVRPDSYLHDNSTLVRIINDETFRNASAAKLSGAVRVATEVFDDDPSVQEAPELWEARFAAFHAYLEDTFPLTYQQMTVETVNSWGLVYTWKGDDSSLKPLLLTAHQDVVPIQEATVKDWTHPPYAGVYDGEYLWGRGSADCKNLLVGLLEAAEELIKDGFKPKRSVLFAFGFDEEISGARGAAFIGKFLLERYGPDSIYAVLDEGGQSLIKEQDIYLALPGTGEKGYVDVKVALTTPGGHSSVPPDHTSIGISGDLITVLESEPFEAIFSERNPTFTEYQCIAVNSPSIDPILKKNILSAGYDKVANSKVLSYLGAINRLRYLVQTSQAIDIINGGAKVNALPEHVEFVINHRVAIEQHTADITHKDIEAVISVAKKYDLGVNFDGDELVAPTVNGYFNVTTTQPLEPAPITPINDAHWKVLGGIIRHVYEEIAYPDGFESPIVIAPGIATGNTDTKYYWDLTKHIYRYRPGLNPTIATNAHSVNEHISFDSHLQIIAFYYEYIQVVDLEDDSD